MFINSKKYQRYYFSENWYNTKINFTQWMLVRFFYFKDYLFKKIPPKVCSSYLTHFPMLIAIPNLVEINSVLELGCGRFSTTLFLDNKFFPKLSKLDSVENDPIWAKDIYEKFHHDQRFYLHNIKGLVVDYLTFLDLQSYDLIFIDDSITREERFNTIQYISNLNLPFTLVVIHDFDMPIYRKAAKKFKNKYRFSALYPNTGLVFNSNSINVHKLDILSQKVTAHRINGDIPSNTEGAVQFFKKCCTNLVDF